MGLRAQCRRPAGWTARRGRRRAPGAWATALMLLAPVALPSPAAAGDPDVLEIASVSFADGLADARAAEPQKKAQWRTSFGSERRSDPEPEPVGGAIDADVVLIQGVTAIKAVRRHFPAKAWRLIVSRQMLASDDPLDPWSRDATTAIPVTAVAVRYQEGLKVTGQEHLMELASAAADGMARPRPAAGTAVRLQFRGRTLWALSVDLSPGSCGADEPGCTEPKALLSWRLAKSSGGEETVTGGRLTAHDHTALPPPPCLHQALMAETPERAGPPLRATGQPREGGACVAELRLSGR